MTANGTPPGNHAEAIYAIWHDPTTYDHLRMGPPYLPGPDTSKALGRPKEASGGVPDSDSLLEVRGLVAKEAANEEVLNVLGHFLSDYGDNALAELGALLSYLRAINFAHQTHHWQTRGSSFFGDHLLFERIYNETLEMIDSLGERTVGAGSPVLVNPVIQSTHQLLILKELYNGVPIETSPEQCVLISLKGVLRFLVLIQLVYGLLEQKNLLSHGTDNLLQGFADKHEEFLYLLKQRTGSDVLASNTGTKTAADWKVR